jgi:hypothetical protein
VVVPEGGVKMKRRPLSGVRPLTTKDKSEGLAPESSYRRFYKLNNGNFDITLAAVYATFIGIFEEFGNPCCLSQSRPKRPSKPKEIA